MPPHDWLLGLRRLPAKAEPDSIQDSRVEDAVSDDDETRIGAAIRRRITRSPDSIDGSAITAPNRADPSP